jgi:acyl carrier protein
MSDQVTEELNEVFRSVFDNPSIEINGNTTSNDIVGWDSFSHMNLITAIELHFNIEFTQTEAIEFKTVGELIQSIEKKIKPS